MMRDDAVLAAIGTSKGLCIDEMLEMLIKGVNLQNSDNKSTGGYPCESTLKVPVVSFWFYFVVYSNCNKSGIDFFCCLGLGMFNKQGVSNPNPEGVFLLGIGNWKNSGLSTLFSYLGEHIIVLTH